MFWNQVLSLVTMLVVASTAAHVFAQDYSYPGYSYPTPPPQNPPYAPEPAPPSPKVSAHRGLQGGFNIGVPIWLDVDTDVVRPGADLHFFGGYDIGYAMFGLNLGGMWTPIDLNNVQGPPVGENPGRSPATRLYVAPEARVQIPNRSPLVPYLAATFDINWWYFRETEILCGFWYCSQVAVFRFTPGFTAKAGFAFRLKEGVHLDVGAKYSLSGPGSFFERREQWVTPYLGILVR
jgi:hypothetical protein